MSINPEWITDVKWWATESTGRGPEARGSFTVAGAVYINFVIWLNKDGGFQVQLPRTANPKFDESKDVGKGNWKHFDEVGCTSNEVREELTRYLVDQLIEERDASPASGPLSSNPIPF